MAPHLNGLVKTVLMRGHNICFYAKLTNMIPKYHQILPLIYSSDIFPFKNLQKNTLVYPFPLKVLSTAKHHNGFKKHLFFKLPICEVSCN